MTSSPRSRLAARFVMCALTVPLVALPAQTRTKADTVQLTEWEVPWGAEGRPRDPSSVLLFTFPSHAPVLPLPHLHPPRERHDLPVERTHLVFG